MRPNLRSVDGMSLIEITIVLIALSILTGVAAPVAKRTVDQARIARAISDEAAIKTAIDNYLNETGWRGFSINGSNPGTGGASVVDTLVSDGDIPRECNPAQGCTTAPLWIDPVNNATGLTDFLERHLVTNNPRGSAANDYPVSTWNGAYINAPIDPDPWGNRYAVNVGWLNNNSNCGNRSNDTFVLSAGPDEEIDTPYRVDVPNCNNNTAGTSGVTPSGDDLINIIRRDPGLTTP